MSIEAISKAFKTVKAVGRVVLVTLQAFLRLTVVCTGSLYTESRTFAISLVPCMIQHGNYVNPISRKWLVSFSLQDLAPMMDSS